MNMTEKEAKKELMRRSKDLDPTVHVGKDGLKESVFQEITNQLKKSRLVKVRLLPAADMAPSEMATAIAEATDSVIVDVRGSIAVITDARTWRSLCEKKV